MKIKAKRRVSLTPRDLLVLYELYGNVVLSFPQLMRKCFPGKAKSTALNRLGKLEGLGVLERWKIPSFRRREAGPEIFVVFQVTRKGMLALKERRTAGVGRDYPIRLHGYSVYHDLLLVDVMDGLRSGFPGAVITNGNLIQQGQGEQIIYPDALMEFANGKERWAVELELTPKSEKRYREIVLRYRLTQDFSRVLYVTGQSEIAPKLDRILDGNLEWLGANPPTEKFVVVDLNALLPTANCQQLEKEILNERTK